MPPSVGFNCKHNVNIRCEVRSMEHRGVRIAEHRGARNAERGVAKIEIDAGD